MIKEDILTDEERNYLKAVIAPVKDKVNFIQKIEYSTLILPKQYIYIDLNERFMNLYPFKSNTEYKGMELNKEYTLKELGLE